MCLLKATLAIIRNAPNHTRANLLLDEDSQTSFSIEYIAITLALQPHRKEDITISFFKDSVKVNVAVVYLLILPT